MVKFYVILLMCFIAIEATLQLDPLSLEMVDHINLKSNTTWKAAPTKFHSWSMQSVKRLMGVPLEILPTMTDGLPVIEHKLTDIPDQFDPRVKWPNCPTLKEIRDQGSCGSCWAISAVEVMSDRICISSNGTDNARISTEDLLSCCHTCGFGCNGGFPRMAFEHWHRSGICTGGRFHSHQGCKPYSIAECEHHVNGSRIPCQGDSHTPKCKSVCTNDDYTVSYKKDKWFGKTVYTLKDVEQIQMEILKNGPIQTSFTVYSDFISYKSGIYQHVTGESVGGHAVKLFGWGVENDVPYWLVANSWNNDWAEDGFFRIIRGKNECDLESGVVGGMPRLV